MYNYQLKLPLGGFGHFRTAAQRIGNGDHKMLTGTMIRFPFADIKAYPVRQLVLILQQAIGNVVVAGFAVNSQI